MAELSAEFSAECLADIVLFSFLTQFFDNKEDTRDAYEKTTNIRSIVELVGKLDTVKRWLENRPKTAF